MKTGISSLVKIVLWQVWELLYKFSQPQILLPHFLVTTTFSFEQLPFLVEGTYCFVLTRKGGGQHFLWARELNLYRSSPACYTMIITNNEVLFLFFISIKLKVCDFDTGKVDKYFKVYENVLLLKFRLRNNKKFEKMCFGFFY